MLRSAYRVCEMDGRMSCWGPTTAASFPCDCETSTWTVTSLAARTVQHQKRVQVAAATFQKCEIKTKCCKMLQAPVWTCCTRPFTLPAAPTTLLLSQSPTLLVVPTTLPSWLFDSIGLISHKANAPQQQQQLEPSSLSYPYMMRKTASKCKCCTGNCSGSCYSPLPSPPPWHNPLLIHPERK